MLSKGFMRNSLRTSSIHLSRLSSYGYVIKLNSDDEAKSSLNKSSAMTCILLPSGPILLLMNGIARVNALPMMKFEIPEPLCLELCFITFALLAVCIDQGIYRFHNSTFSSCVSFSCPSVPLTRQMGRPVT